MNGLKVKARPLKLIPSTRVTSLCARIEMILNSKEFTNSQKIAMMRIATQELAKEAQ